MSKKRANRGQPTEGLVLDCSIVMAWYFADETSDYADAVARQLPGRTVYVPLNWPLEVTNALVMGERRRRSTQAQAARLIAYLAALPITIDDEANVHAWGATLGLARGQNLTAYDAAYLELAVRRGLPLATLDDQLKAAAETVGVTPYAVR